MEKTKLKKWIKDQIKDCRGMIRYEIKCTENAQKKLIILEEIEEIINK